MPMLHRSDAVKVTGSVDFTTEGTHNVGTCLFFSILCWGPSVAMPTETGQFTCVRALQF